MRIMNVTFSYHSGSSVISSISLIISISRRVNSGWLYYIISIAL